eukprot:365334-Chlamydomonas_euryale.AAC.24
MQGGRGPNWLRNLAVASVALPSWYARRETQVDQQAVGSVRAPPSSISTEIGLPVAQQLPSAPSPPPSAATFTADGPGCAPRRAATRTASAARVYYRSMIPLRTGVCFRATGSSATCPHACAHFARQCRRLVRWFRLGRSDCTDPETKTFREAA